MWLKDSAPDLFERAQVCLSISDWLNFHMTGEAAFERSLAAETMLLDLGSGEWAWDLVESLELPRHLFPELVLSGSQVGELLPSVAQDLGLQAGTPVIAGGADTQCALLACQSTQHGQLGVVAGTTTPIQLVIERPLIDPEYRLWTGLHMLPERWVLESNMGQSGEALEWIAGVIHADARDPAAMFIASAAGSPPGAMGITSSIGAEQFNARELGVPTGEITFSPILEGDDPGHRNHVARAVLEGIAFGVKANISQLVELTGIKQPEISLAGGLSRSELFAQILSDVCEAPVMVPGTTEASALGAAICAAVGAGMAPDLSESASQLAAEKRTISPQHDLVPRYSQLYTGWQELQRASIEASLMSGEIALNAIAEGIDRDGSPTQSHISLSDRFRPRILVTAQLEQASIAELRQLGEVRYEDYRQEMRLLSGQDLVEELEGSHILVTEIDIVDLDALKDLPDLRLVICCRGNPVNVDIDACTALGIPVLNAPGRNAGAVADLVLAFMLMLGRDLPAATQFLRQEGIEAGDLGRMGMAYERFQGQELWNSTVGLVGLGAIGRRVAQRLAPFGARVLGYDPYISADRAALAGVDPVSLETLLDESDFVSLHAPVTDETLGMIDAPALGRMKPGAYLINTARAALVDEAALYEALASRHLGGAALDVFSVEPPGSDHLLLTLKNVIVTPHIGGNTHQVAAHQGAIVVSEVRRMLAGETPEHVLNPGAITHFSWTADRQRLTADELEQLAGKPGPGVSDLEVQGRHETASESIQAEERPSPEGPGEVKPKKSGILTRVRRIIAPDEKGDFPMTTTTDSQQTAENLPAKLRMVLARFTELSREDQPLVDFSQNREFTMHFLVTDLKLEFYLRFDHGNVTGELSAPASPPDLTLKMKADILDGMLTGRTNATRAAMTGKIAFSGDTRKAMSMQKVQKDLTRLYTQARQEVGDPGDLSALAELQQPAGAPEPTLTRPSQAAAPAAYVPVGDERDEIIPVLNELYNAGLITATGGNISVRAENDPQTAWITPSQIFKGDLRAEMMVHIDMQGEPLDDEALSASSERLVHCALYRARPDVGAVVHTHAPNTTVLMLAGLPFQAISTEAAFIGEIPVVPFIMPGTQELGDAVAEAIGDGVAVFMQNHGLVVAGSSLRRAADLTETIETTAEKLILLHLLGVDPPELPAEVVEELGEYKGLMG
jgi:autoinducer 2 (AI-2) kinase